MEIILILFLSLVNFHKSRSG